MQWDNSKNCGFSVSDSPYLPTGTPGETVSVETEEKREDSLYHTVKEIIALRHRYEDLQADGSFEVVYVKENAYPLIYRRGNLLVMVNPSAQPVETVLPGMQAGRETVYQIGEAVLDEGKAKMGPQSFAVVQL